MEFSEYQKKSWETAIYPKKGNNLVYPALGLGGESGEVLEKIKKMMRNEDFKLNEDKKRELKKEIGDVLWYIASLATELKLDLDDIAVENISKLQSRKERSQLHGSGDNR